MHGQKRVVVAMSGGVDSSVTAAVLKARGYDVVGMMLRLWSEPGKEGSNRCCTPDSMALARRVAAQLGIPFYAIDAREVFRDEVVQDFIDGYTQGVTPNPCLACNRTIRWGFLLKQALALGADFMATGHYARLHPDNKNHIHMLRAIDRSKDQSYVLHVLSQQQLKYALFPLGDYTKPVVRHLAKQFHLPVAQRADSQDLCFLAGEDYRNFLQRHAPGTIRPGPICNVDGKVLGQHQGLASYTIGQRKGLGVASPNPLYVLDKIIESNTLIVGTVDQLGQTSLEAEAINWITPVPFNKSHHVQVKIRYSSRLADAKLTPLSPTRARILFTQPQRDITPGQAAVFYQGDHLLGGGTIVLMEHAFPIRSHLV